MKLRFFCEQCGTEVPRNTVRCPVCGRYFTAVQCPRCGFQGRESDFASGCPTCGYMRGQAEAGRRPPARRAGSSRRRARPRAGGAGSSARSAPLEDQGTPGPPPSAYKIMGIVLLALLGILIALLLLL